jgi:hypothetical protein
MLFSSPYYKFSKKTLKFFDLKSKEAAIGNLLAAIFIYRPSHDFLVPANIYKDNKIVEVNLYVVHCFFTDKGIFLINDPQLRADFFEYSSIKKIDIKKSTSSSMEIYLKPELILDGVMDLIDLPIKQKAADRILNLRSDLSQYVEINEVKGYSNNYRVIQGYQRK